MSERYGTEEALINGFSELMLGRPHQIARTQINAKLIEMAQVELGLNYLQRFPVPAELADWHVELPGYDPFFIDLPRGNTRYKKPDDRVDPTNPRAVEDFFSQEARYVRRDIYGRPMNPIGRTGLTGRGMLNKWGATQAADAVLTRQNPHTKKVEVLLVTRGDTGELAVPGGKLNEGEMAWQAAGREVIEETGLKGIAIDFALARLVYVGYVDDSRNTDNAWMESSVFHYHLTDDEATNVSVQAGSDADQASWVELKEDLYRRLFASHGQYLRAIIKEWP